MFSFLLFSTLSFAASKAPDFTLRDINGKQHSLSDYEGKVVLLNFWATWCGPCQSEMPHIQKMKNELEEEGLVVLSVSIDEAKDISKVKPLVKRNRYDFTVLLDKETKVVSLYNPDKTVPYTSIIDRDGNLYYSKVSYAPGDEVELKKKVKSALKGKEALQKDSSENEIQEPVKEPSPSK
jgi:peroxiredoxin